MGTNLTASAPTRDLLGALARRGWGDLAGPQWRGLHNVLRALVDVLPYRSGVGQTTAGQLADVACLSERWTRYLLGELESLGLITWTRGGVIAGRPQPSLIRLDKRALLALIHGARARLDEIRAKRAARTTARLRGLRMVTVRPRRRTPGHPHAELNASPTPSGGGDRARSAAAPGFPDTWSEDFTPAPMPAYLREAITRRDPSIITRYLEGKNQL